MLETKKKWSYKLMVADQLDRKYELITKEEFFLDWDFLEKSFGISFSDLETFDPKYKNTILLKIAQIDSGLIIGNCSFRGFLMSEMAYKFKEGEPWKEFVFLDNINLKPHEQIFILINSYKIILYDINLAAGKSEKITREKISAFETFRKFLNEESKEEITMHKENEQIRKELPEERKEFQEKQNDDIPLKEKKNTLNIALKSKENEDKPKKVDTNEKTEELTEFKKDENQNKEKEKEKDKASSEQKEEIKGNNDTADEIDYLDKCLKDYFAKEENKNPETSDPTENSCYDYFGHHFDFQELLSEKPIKNQETPKTKKEKNQENNVLSSEMIIDKKKRRTSTFSEEEDIFKKFHQNKKKFKFDSPIVCSAKAESKPLLNSNLDKNNPEISKEVAAHQEELDSKAKKYNRLKKVKEIQDENTCPICLELISQEKGHLTCKHVFCANCIKDWSNVTNFCPLCKSEFREIEIKSKDSESFVIKVTPKKQRSDHYEDEDDEYDQSDDLCYICDQGENTYLLLVCDSCKYFCCHTYCLDPPLNSIPEGEWICFYCQRERENSRSFSFNMNNFFNNGDNNSRSNGNRNTNNRNGGRNTRNNNNNNRGGRSNNNRNNANGRGRRRRNDSQTINEEKKLESINFKNFKMTTRSGGGRLNALEGLQKV